MIAVDTNILIYSHRVESAFHRAARKCIEGLAERGAAWLIPWPCIHEFLSIVTHPRIYSPPTPLATAIHQVERWIESPSLVIAGESEQHWQTLRAIVTRTAITGPRIHDGRIAAICIEQNVSELWSADRDFTRIHNLKVVNPLRSA